MTYKKIFEILTQLIDKTVQVKLMLLTRVGLGVIGAVIDWLDREYGATFAAAKLS